MNGIGQFFDGFRNKALIQINNYSRIVEIIKKHTKVQIEIKDISISNGVINIKSNQTMKNEIYIKKEAILKELKGWVKGITIVDLK